MQVRILVTKSLWPEFRLWIAPGQKLWVDEKQAEIYVNAGVAEIIEREEATFKPKLSKRAK